MKKLLILLLFTPAFTTAAGPGAPDKTRRALLDDILHVKQEFADKQSPGAAPASQENFDVFNYKLDIVLDTDKLEISGSTGIFAVSLTDGLTSIDLDFHSVMNVIEVWNSSGNLTFSHNDNILTVTLDKAYNAGDTIRVAVEYDGKPQQAYWGAFMWEYHGSDLVVATLSEPWGARTWWPCKDRPDDKATAEIQITAPDWMTCVANGELESRTNNGDGTFTFRWVESYPLTTYLVSIACTNYAYWTDTYVTGDADTMRIDFFAYPEDYNKAQEDWNVTAGMIETFVGLFGEYPFIQERYGMAEFPWTYGAMEHQTCTSYGSGLITGDHYFDPIVAHELAHQWWGDLVTCETWADIWLNEGFATYSEALEVEVSQGEQAFADYIDLLESYSGYFSDTVYDPTELFSITVYKKGGLVLHMLRHIMGSEAFFNGLREYGWNSGFAYGTAKTDDFNGVMESIQGSDLDWFFEPWLNYPWYPHYRYSWSKSMNGGDWLLNLRIEQEQTQTLYTMPIDVKISFDGGDTLLTIVDSLEVQVFQIILPDEPTNVVLDPDNWILCDLKYVGVDNESGDAPRALTGTGIGSNRPNPFNPRTVIPYFIGGNVPAAATLSVYDMTGRLVRTLVDDVAAPGEHSAVWDGRDGAGHEAVSGVYICRLQCGNFSDSRRLVMLK